MLNETREITKKIAYYRKKKKITQKQLAQMLNVSHTTVSGWETGTNAISLEMLSKVCDLLELPYENIFGWEITNSGENEHIIWSFFNKGNVGNYYLRIKVYISGITNDLPLLCLHATDNSDKFREVLKTDICLSDYEKAPKDKYGFATICSNTLTIDEKLSDHPIEGKILLYNSFHTAEDFKIILGEIAWMSADADDDIDRKSYPISVLYSDDIARWTCKSINGTFAYNKAISADDSTFSTNQITVTQSERNLLIAYRSQPEMQSAVKKILGLE